MERLLRQFQEDATALYETLVSPGPLRPSNVRALIPAIVRKWLIDGHINSLSRVLNDPLLLPAVATTKAKAEVSADVGMRFFLAGGVVLDGMPLRGIYFTDTPYEGRAMISEECLATQMFRPSEYLSSPRVYFDGQWFNSEQIIRFVSNKYGGIHWDPTRPYPWQLALERAARFFTLGNPDELDSRQALELFDPDRRILLVLPRERGVVWSCLEIELLSVAQALLNVHRRGQTLLDLPGIGPSTAKE